MQKQHMRDRGKAQTAHAKGNGKQAWCLLSCGFDGTKRWLWLGLPRYQSGPAPRTTATNERAIEIYQGVQDDGSKVAADEGLIATSHAATQALRCCSGLCGGLLVGAQGS